MSEFLNNSSEDSPEVAGVAQLLTEGKAALDPEVPVLTPRDTRGRPKGSKNKNGYKKRGSTPPPQPEPEMEAAAPQPAPPGTYTMLAVIMLKMPFAIAAGKTGCEALVLTDDEAATPAQFADQLMCQYFPALEQKHGPAYALCASLVGVGVGKFFAFRAWQEAKFAAAKPVNEGATPVA